MEEVYQPGPVAALLDEYKKAIADLQRTIADISDAELVMVADSETTDVRCRSLQTVLAHVVSAGHAYASYIRRLRKQSVEFPRNVLRSSIGSYRTDLDDLFRFTVETFADIQESEMEECDNEKKIVTAWGQTYDIEQITEHAIVHVLRHRRQIERFKKVLRENKPQ